MRRRPGAVGRRVKPRSYGRTLAFLGFVNVLVSFLMPWFVRGINFRKFDPQVRRRIYESGGSAL